MVKKIDTDKYPALPADVTAVPDPDEAAAHIEAETTANDASDAGVEEGNENSEIKLSAPIEVNGKKTDVIKFDLNRLTGAAATKAERLFRLKAPDWPDDKNIFNSITYWLILASIAAGIPYKDIENMPMLDALIVGGELKSRFFERSEIPDQQS